VSISMLDPEARSRGNAGSLENANRSKRENAMNIRARLLAGLMGSALLAGSAFAAATSDTALVTSARQGDRAAVQSALQGLSRQEVAGQQGTAALAWAATRNDLEMVDLLLRAGADPKAANEFGATALYAASGHADPAMAQKLLAAGADPNVALPSGETPLMLAASRGNLATVRVLLAAKADPNAKDVNGGQTPLMWALAERQAAVVAELIKGGADVNLGSKSGFTPLMFAAQQNDVDSGRLLLQAGAKVDTAQPRTGLTALIVAAAMSHVPSVDLLLENGANPNAKDANGYTPLLKVVRDSDYGVNLTGKDAILATVKSLLKHKADPNVRLEPDRAKAAAELEYSQGQNDRRRIASTVNEVSLMGATPILLAAEVNNLDVIKALVEAGGDPLLATEQGTTPLMLAAGGGTDIQRMRPPEERAMAIETVKYLVEKGANVNDAGQYGWTAMHSAAYQGLTDVIDYLASKGASVNQMDAFGQTPLSISMAVLTQDIGARRPQIPRRFRGEVAQLLLKLGATPLDKSGVVVILQRTGDLDVGRAGDGGGP
jgi:ankyrin repeat protein